MPEGLGDLIDRYLAEPSAGWSLGTFGAIAEFLTDAGEAKATGAGWIATGRGAMRIAPGPGVRAIAYETAGSAPGSWAQAVALCLPEADCAMNGRTVLTELGLDRDAVRPEDRAAVLFDLGLGCRQIDACVRTADPEALALLRASAGRPLLDHGNPAFAAMPRLSPHRVFLCRFGRIEVFQPIPPPDGESPEGPHTHLLPKLLASGRTHAATSPIPEGLVPCMHLFPAHPLKDQMGRPTRFDGAAHAAFQDLLARFGLAELNAVKAAVRHAVGAGAAPERFAELASREGRASLKVTLRQLAAEGIDVAPWLRRFDRAAEAA